MVPRVGLIAPEIWICSCGGLRPTHTQCVYHALRKIRNLEEDFCPPRILSVRLRRMASWPEILFCTPGRQDARTPGRQDARTPGRQDAKIAKIAKIAKEGCAGGGVCRWRKSAAILRISSALFLDCLCKILKQLMPSWLTPFLPLSDLHNNVLRGTPQKANS